MSVIADYIDLRKAVMDLVKNPAIVESLDRSTKAAELWISRALRHQRQETSASLAFVSGRAALPSDFIEALHVWTPTGGELQQGPLSVTKETGSGNRWFAVDGTEMVINGLTGTRDIVYFAAIPTITGSLTGTNWALVKYPDLYLFATAYEAVKGIGDVDAASAMIGVRAGALDEARIDGDRAKYGQGVVRIGGVVA